MKKKLLLTFALLLTAATGAWANVGDHFVVNNVYYYITSESPKNVYVDGYYGDMPANYELVIPASVTNPNNSTDYSVTGIRPPAFLNKTNLESVTIPSSVTYIGQQAFDGCTNLATVSGCEGVTYVGNDAFRGTAWLTNQPDGVVYIGRGAYLGKNVSGVVSINEGTVSISSHAFEYCTGLTSITIPSSVTYIDDNAFKNCSGLTSVSIPSSVTYIGDDAFEYCSGLTSITIPSSVTDISDYAFYGCSGLESVTVYAPSCYLGINAFQNCNSLAHIYVFEDKVTYYQGADNWSDHASIITAIPPVITSYIDANGTLHENVEAIPLNYAMTTAPGGWYVVNSDVTYTSTVTITGNVTLILADGYTMNIGTSGSRIIGEGIKHSGNETLTIYGQSASSGALSIYTTGTASYGIWAKAITIDGGHITVDTEGVDAFAFYINNGGCTINGGTVTASATSADAFTLDDNGNFTYTGGIVTTSAPNGYAIFAMGNCNFSWRNASDCITISAGGLCCDVGTTAFNSTFTDGNNTYSGTLTDSEINALAGKTLYPYIEELDLAANLAPDGNYWTTFYCSHTNYLIDVGENATAYTAEVSGDNIILHSLNKDVPKNTAVIIKGKDNEISMTKVEDPDLEIPTNDLHGVDVQTTIDDIKTDLGDGTFYVLGKTTVGTEEHFGFHKYTGATMPARKAFLLVSGGGSSNFFGFEDEETTSIGASLNDKGEMKNDNYYDLLGRKVQTSNLKSQTLNLKKGIYIVNGKKVIVK